MFHVFVSHQSYWHLVDEIDLSQCNVMCVSSFLYNALNICPRPTFLVIWHKEMAKFSVISGLWTRAQQVPSTRPLPNIFPSLVLKIIVNPEYWVLPDTSGIPDILEHCVYP